MRWSDEPYVKIYTRDTPEFMTLSWQARCLLSEIVRKVDRAGILKVGKLGAVRGVAIAIQAPSGEVDGPVQELIADGRLVFSAERGEVLVPNHIEAQDTPQSDIARKRRSRDGARAKFNEVTPGHDMSRPVTPGHVESRPVTLEEKRREEMSIDHGTATPPEPTTAVRRRKPAKVAPHRCPKGWAPTEAIYEWALADGIEREVVDVIAHEFVAHWSDPENLVERPGWNMSFKGRVTWLRKNNKLPSPPEKELPIIRHPDRDRYIPKPGQSESTAAVLSLFGVGK